MPICYVIDAQSCGYPITGINFKVDTFNWILMLFMYQSHTLAVFLASICKTYSIQ